MKKRAEKDNRMFDPGSTKGDEYSPGLPAADEKRLRGVFDSETAARDRSNDSLVPFPRILSEIRDREQKRRVTRLRYTISAGGIAALLIAGIALWRFLPAASGEVIVFAGTIQKNGAPFDVKIFDRIAGGTVVAASKRLMLRYDGFALIDVGVNASVKLDDVRFRNGRGAVVAALHGETRFHVRRQSEQDFFTVIIGTNRTRGVSVMGTIFSVRTVNEDEFDVACIQGAVRIFERADTITTVNAGNAIRFSKGKISPITIPHTAAVQELIVYPIDKIPGERAVVVNDTHTIALSTPNTIASDDTPHAIQKSNAAQTGKPMPVETVEKKLSTLKGKRIRVVTIDQEVLSGIFVAENDDDQFTIKTPVALVAIDKRKVLEIAAEKQR
ncbi:MAG: hypothetical protein AABZ39_12265 [Spirochaetota bacterium]